MLGGVGPFADGLRARGIDWQAPGTSTVRYLSDHGVLETKPLLAHCINVDEDDLQLLKNAGAGVAHCPKSNAKLGHGRAPFAQFIAHELNVGLGSDSVASNNTCDLLEEARFATLSARASEAQSSPSTATVSAEQALFAATLGGAQALGCANRIGALREGLQADMAIVRLDSMCQQPVRDPAGVLIFSSSGRDVMLTLVAGKEICRNGHMTTMVEDDLKMRLDRIREKLDGAV